MLTEAVATSLSTTYSLPLESVTLTEQMYSPLSAVSTLDIINPTLVAFTELTLLYVVLGAVQLDMTVVGVATELGWMEQVRERGEPDTNSDSAADTITTGLGTEGEIQHIFHNTRAVFDSYKDT